MVKANKIRYEIKQERDRKVNAKWKWMPDFTWKPLND